MAGALTDDLGVDAVAEQRRDVGIQRCAWDMTRDQIAGCLIILTLSLSHGLVPDPVDRDSFEGLPCGVAGMVEIGGDGVSS